MLVNTFGRVLHLHVKEKTRKKHGGSAAFSDQERGDAETLFGHETTRVSLSLYGSLSRCLPNRPVTLARNSWNVKEKERGERANEVTNEGRDCPREREQKSRQDN